jgi:hypothetical protein
MKITRNTPIHYFIKDESDKSFHKMEAESYLEIPQRDGTSNFKRIEDVRLFIAKDVQDHEIISFQFGGGRNDCMGHWAKNLKDLVESQESDVDIYRFKKVDQKSYLEQRSKIFEIYLNHPKTDYSRLKVGSEYN